MVAEILLQFKENLSVHPGKRYTTRTVTGAQLCHSADVVMRQVCIACKLHSQHRLVPSWQHATGMHCLGGDH
jgi:hypothetical protein